MSGRRAGSACFRFKRGDDGPASMQDHDVPVTEGTTVLEALRWIQLQVDPSLALRHSCFHASCGTCGVRVNGREGPRLRHAAGRRRRAAP